MGRGSGYTIDQNDFRSMTSAEISNAFRAAIIKKGTAVVRDKDGNVKYDDPSRAGTYGGSKHE